MSTSTIGLTEISRPALHRYPLVPGLDIAVEASLATSGDPSVSNVVVFKPEYDAMHERGVTTFGIAVLGYPGEPNYGADAVARVLEIDRNARHIYHRRLAAWVAGERMYDQWNPAEQLSRLDPSDVHNFSAAVVTLAYGENALEFHRVEISATPNGAAVAATVATNYPEDSNGASYVMPYPRSRRGGLALPPTFPHDMSGFDEEGFYRRGKRTTFRIGLIAGDICDQFLYGIQGRAEEHTDRDLYRREQARREMFNTISPLHRNWSAAVVEIFLDDQRMFG